MPTSSFPRRLAARREALFSSRVFSFHSSQQTLFEVEKHIPFISRRTDRSELELLDEVQLLPITVHQPRMFEDHFRRAGEMIGQRDPRNVDLLALVLLVGYPLWTQDRDFDNLPGVIVHRTQELLGML